MPSESSTENGPATTDAGAVRTSGPTGPAAEGPDAVSLRSVANPRRTRL